MKGEGTFVRRKAPIVANLLTNSVFTILDPVAHPVPNAPPPYPNVGPDLDWQKSKQLLM